MRIPPLLKFEKDRDRGDAEAEDSQCLDSAEQDQQESIRGLSDLYYPEQSEQMPEQEQTSRPHIRDVADVLLEIGEITSDQYGQVRHQCRLAGDKIDASEILLKLGMADAETLLKGRAILNDMEFRRIEPSEISKEAYNKLILDSGAPISDCIIGLAVDGSTLIAATSEPENVLLIEDVKRQIGMDLRVVVCPRRDIDAACDYFANEVGDYCVDDIIGDMTEVEVVQDQEKDFEDLEKMAGQSPVIKFVNYLISNAVREGASDIHIEPKPRCTRIRYRIDGVLFQMMESPVKMHSAVVSRIKIMSNLDISERRLPQDGKISVIVAGRGIDLRVSVLPTSHGEKVVIRILDSSSILRGLDQLGMEPDVMGAFGEQIALPHGILLVTGPTGSGKSTTLYSALGQMDGEKLNVSTVEDPVEYELDFCNQVQVREQIGMTFASALRSLLRQDPDIIMIGEIRDNETARIAVQAALTGHLVLSTLHTNDAPSSITRLVNIGIDAYLIAASLNAVLAQRLVRKICPKCKEPYEVPENMRRHIELAGVSSENLFHGAGCDHCRGSGYAGRLGIYELLIIDDSFKDMINKDASVTNMRQEFRQSGQASLFDDGIKKVQQGLTTIEEVLRVTEAYIKSDQQVSEEQNV